MPSRWKARGWEKLLWEAKDDWKAPDCGWVKMQTRWKISTEWTRMEASRNVGEDDIWRVGKWMEHVYHLIVSVLKSASVVTISRFPSLPLNFPFIHISLATEAGKALCASFWKGSVSERWRRQEGRSGVSRMEKWSDDDDLLVSEGEENSSYARIMIYMPFYVTEFGRMSGREDVDCRFIFRS